MSFVFLCAAGMLNVDFLLSNSGFFFMSCFVADVCESWIESSLFVKVYAWICLGFVLNLFQESMFVSFLYIPMNTDCIHCVARPKTCQLPMSANTPTAPQSGLQTSRKSGRIAYAASQWQEHVHVQDFWVHFLLLTLLGSLIATL